MKNSDDKYEKAKNERQKYFDAILNSPLKKKIVVAGPGTGKTFLFGEVSKKSGGEPLTLTFINALVDDLSLGLFGLSTVKTLHGFSIGLLREKIGAKIFPKLSEVIQKDALILIGKKDINFDKIFQEGKGKKDIFDFYKERKDYYGKYYGFSDVILKLVQYLDAHKDEIPKYSQILVDEFQDFNKVEVMLIDLLSEKSPILIVGDDDQSLYGELKSANPKYIREKHRNTCPDYKSFPLPFCSRSTEVIVEVANDIIKSAKNNGLLKERVDKAYKYFPCEEKDSESEENSQIIYSQKFKGQLPYFIQNKITEIASKERKSFSVLIIVPPQLKNNLLPVIAKFLVDQGFRNIFYPSSTVEKKQAWIDGFKILLDDEEDNLGWRIFAELIFPGEEFTKIIKESRQKSKKIINLFDGDRRKEIEKMFDIFKKIRDGKKVKEEELAIFFEKIGHQPHQPMNEKFRQKLQEDVSFKYEIPRGIKDIPITITTIPGSKGLSGDYVFITHFDNNYYIEDKKRGISDKDIFKFLVALTRAKKEVFLISSKEEIPIFLQWIDKSRIKLEK